MTTTHDPKAILIGVVGPCVSGKTTISNMLLNKGYSAKVIAQEHSYVPAMWQIISKPEFLVYLNVSYTIAQARRKMNWNISEYERQLERLNHAFTHADLRIDTDELPPEKVCNKIITSLNDFLKAIDG